MESGASLSFMLSLSSPRIGDCSGLQSCISGDAGVGVVVGQA